MRFRFAIGLVAVLALLAGSMSPEQGSAASFRPIRAGLNQPQPSRANGISADGSAVVGSTSNGFPFLWTENGGTRLIGTYLGYVGIGAAISGDGSTVAVEEASDATLWSEDQGWRTLRTLTDPSWIMTPTGLSFDGSVAVGWRLDYSNNYHAFRWDAEGGMVDIAGPGTRARGVSADGTTVVYDIYDPTVSLTGSLGGGIWDAEFGARPLSGFPDDDPVLGVRAISADGSTVVGYAGGTGAFRWTERSGPERLGAIPGHERTTPHAVSADGSVVVGEARGVDGARAFIWRAGVGIQPLDVLLTTLGIDIEGWSLLTATGVSADGTRIIGFGRDPGRPAFERHPFIVVIPEPGTALLVGLGLALLGARRRA